MLLRILFIIVASGPAFWRPVTPTSADQIRSARQQIDKTFSLRDARQLRQLFTEDCHFIAPTVHLDGVDALMRFHVSLFTKRPDVTFIHEAKRIEVNENWDLASEHGSWIERWTDKDGVTELRGTYLTMWKRDRGQWREYSEIIVPESCTGSSYCKS